MVLQIGESTKLALDLILIVLMNLLAEDFAALICGDTVWTLPFMLHVRQNLVKLLVLIRILSFNRLVFGVLIRLGLLIFVQVDGGIIV